MRLDPAEVAEQPRADAPARDGIGEEDNPIPLWFNVAFYGMLVLGVLYILYFDFSGWSQKGQYATQLERASQRVAAAAPSAPAASVNPYRGSPDALSEGKEVYATICAACHLPDGRGLVGPSLVDPYWKYGSDDASLFETVAKGRPAGMPAWAPQLGTEKIWKVLAYLETLPRSDAPGVGAPDYQPPAATAAASGG